MSFIGLLLNVVGERSDISDVPSSNCRNAYLEYAQKTYSRTSSYQ